MTKRKSTKSSGNKQLSTKQRLKLLMTPCKTKQELKNWIKYHLNLDIPDCTVSRYASTNPMEAIWRIYDICVNKNNPEKIEELLYVASRGSGKTLGVAIAELLVMLHDQRDIVHVGAILSQAKRCYEYQVGFMLNDKLKPLLRLKIKDEPILEKMNMEKSVFNLIDRYTKELIKTTLEVLPCTLKAVNGPHVPLVVVDEVDTVSGEGLKAFNDISGMLDSRPNRDALRVGISTRKSRYGLMNKQIEEAQQAGRTVHWWTALEFTERCPDSRSGRVPTVGYVLQDEMEVITEEQWKRKSKQKKEEYFKHEFYGEGCLKCPIAALCLSDSKKQKSSSDMLKPITDPIKKAMESGPDWAISQLFNLKPSIEGIVYKEFDTRRHVKSWNGMWEVLTGTKFPGECTHDMFVKKCFSADTEVLTNSGFKRFSQLTPDDRVASLDSKGNLVYDKPLDYIKHDYSGKMINIYNKCGRRKHLDLLITPDHEQTYVNRKNINNGKFKLFKIRADKLADNANDFTIPATYYGTTTNTNKGYSSPISYMDDEFFYAFLGIWLGEGSIDVKQRRVTISQTKSETIVNSIKAIIDAIPFKNRVSFIRDKNLSHRGIWSIQCDELLKYLRQTQLAQNKRIPRVILEEASPQQLYILLCWLCFSDESYMLDGSAQQPYYATNSKKLADDVQELCFRIGIKASISKYKVLDKHSNNRDARYISQYKVHFTSNETNISSKKEWHINNNTNTSTYGNKKTTNIKSVDYNGPVYCLTMPHGNLFVRRGSAIVNSGNCRQMKLQCYAGIDFGWSNPSTVVFLYVDNKENVYVVRCEGQTYTNNPTWIQTIKNKWHHMYRVQMYFPDLANPGDGVTMRQEGLPCPNEQTKDTNGGIQVVKKWLKSLASPVPKIFFAEETCGPIIEEFQKYHYKLDASGRITDEPAKEHDHWLDALRYTVYALFSKTKFMIANDEADNGVPVVDNDGNFSRFPSPEEFAAAKNINFNSEIDTRNLGKIGKLSELEDDDDDDVNGSGGFLWSF